MLRKFTLHLFHENKICESICKIKYPWGWKSKNNIYQFKENLYKKNSNFVSTKLEQNFDENDFLKNSIMAYNLIYKTYLKKLDFLDFEYTTPKLSIALNELRTDIDCDIINNLPIEIQVNKNDIINKSIKNEITTSNFKFLGYFDKFEISNQISTGMIGPEIRHLWDQLPVKQVVNVSYKSDNFYDILEWERDLTIKNPEWQVSNINNIIR